MRHVRLAGFVFALLLLVAAGCGGGGDGGISDEEIKVRSDRIRAYFAAKRDAREIVATTTTDSGQVLDWIYPETQVAGGVVELPPDPYDDLESAPGAENPANDSPGGKELAGLSELATQPHAQGPIGTVPLVRFDVEVYLATIVIPPEDPQDVLKKVPPPSPASNDRYYVHWGRDSSSDSYDFYGTSGRINVWETTGPVSNETSIAQLAILRPYVSATMEAIEAGKTENQSLNGNKRPHFFTYYRTNGAASGDWQGGYNAIHDGWIQVSTTVMPGMSLIPWESVEGGSQYSVEVEARIYQGNWWVAVAGEWAGYYPQRVGGGSTGAFLFDTSGIRTFADNIVWYGEIYDESAPAATSTDMGSGDFATDGWEHAAYFRNLTFFWQPATYWWFDRGSLGVTDGACYTGSGPFFHSTNSAWRNWFYYGGPGKEAGGCN